MKCQSLFSGKNKKKYLVCHHRVLSVKEDAWMAG